MTQITTFAEAEERLAESLPGYESRVQQRALASAIEDAIAIKRPLIAEAGCGTGKSLATLIPAILSGKRTVISTATKALQDQVALKDLPFLAEHLGVPFTHAILKGRSNYLCKAAAFDAKAEAVVNIRGVRERLVAEDFQGERDDLGFEVSNIDWLNLTVSGEECPGKKTCAWGQECYAERAKTKAQEADVVVTNHAMLSVDTLLAQGDLPGVMLGPYDVLIVDEAHELEQYARNAWTTRMTERTFEQLNSNVRTWTHDNTDHGSAMDDLLAAAAAATRELWATFEEGRLRHGHVLEHEDQWVHLIQSLQAVGERFATWEGKAHDDVQANRYLKIRSRIVNTIRRLVDIAVQADGVIVRWIEQEEDRRGKKTLTLKSAPLELGAILHNGLWQHVTPVLVSATLEVDGSFEYPASRLGVTDFDSLNVGTPFDFETQSLLYVPTDLPAPEAKTRDAWSAMAIAETRDLVRAAGGRALLLFTSVSQMRTAYEALERFLPYTCLMQGQLPNKRLAELFKADETSVLFATRSFFTGVDFAGSTCSLVIVDKLPFATPTDPLVSAQTELIEARGGNAFGDYTIPEMTLVLTQAFGRLIRSKTDRGVVAILDPRLLRKGYGRRILRSLPKAPVTSKLEEVEAFFQKGC